MQRVARSVEDRRAQVSLHLKILAGYVTLAAALVAVFYVGSAWDWTLKIIVGLHLGDAGAGHRAALTSCCASAACACLSATALEISRGDL
jgi:uncharacterized protein (UPF0333 family)